MILNSASTPTPPIPQELPPQTPEPKVEEKPVLPIPAQGVETTPQQQQQGDTQRQQMPSEPGVDTALPDGEGPSRHARQDKPDIRQQDADRLLRDEPRAAHN